MNEFVNIEILSTIAGCSVIITLLTQVFKSYLPEKIDTKWLALVFSIIIGVLRIIYLQQFDFAGIVTGVLNIFVLLSVAIGVYEIGDTTAKGIKNINKNIKNKNKDINKDINKNKEDQNG